MKSWVLQVLLMLIPVSIVSTAAGQSSVLATQDHAALLTEGEDILRTKLDMILSAKVEVLSGEFLFRQDDTGLMKLAAMREAARRGVKVRMYVDALHNLIEPAMIYALQQEGIEVQVFNAFRWRKFFSIDQRDHSKVLVVDRKLFTAGDTNTGDEYVGRGEEHNMRSRDLFVIGNSAQAAAQYLLKVLDSNTVTVPRIQLASAQDLVQQNEARDRRKELIKKILKFLRLEIDAPDVLSKPQVDFFTAEQLAEAKLKLDRGQRLQEELRAKLKWGEPVEWLRSRLFQVNAAKFLHDPIGMKGKLPGMEQDVLDMIHTSQRTLKIISPYLVLPAEELRAIQMATDRGVKVQIFTNSVQSSDNKTVQAAYEMRFNQIVGILKGVEIYEWMGAETWHAKALVADEKHLVIMGFNMDYRSKNINMETGQYVQSEALVHRMNSQLEVDKGQFLLVAQKGKILESKVTYRTCEQVFSSAAVNYVKAKKLQLMERRL